MKQESRSRYLIKNTVIFTIGNLGTRLISFFLVPLYTYQLTTSQFGVVDLINTIGTMIGPILILNINESVMRFSLDKDANRYKIISVGTLIYLTSFISGILLLVFSNFYKPLIGYGVFVYLFTIGYAGHQLYFGYLRGKEKLVSFAVGNIITTLSIALLNILFLLKFHWGINGYLLAYIVSYFLTILYAVITGGVLPDLKKWSLDPKLGKAMLKYSVLLIPNTFMWWIINSSDRVMVTSMIGSSANGIYAISYKLPSLLQTFITIFSTAWSYSAIREMDSSDNAEFSNQVYSSLHAVAIIIGLAMMFIMKPFLSVYVEESYYEAWKYTPYLIIGFVFLSLASFLGTSYQVYKDSKGMLFSSVAAAITNLLLNLILIPMIGVSGAALATCISYVVVFVYRAINTQKYVKINVIDIHKLFGFIALIAGAVCMFIESRISLFAIGVLCVANIFIYRNEWLPLAHKTLGKILKKK